MEHIAFSDEISHNCDLIVHLEQSEEQALQNILALEIVKYRDGKSNVKFELFCDWDLSFLGNIFIENTQTAKVTTENSNKKLF